MSSPLKPLSESLGLQVTELEARATQVLRLTNLVRATLPEPLKNHVLSAAYRDDVLVVSVESGAWTTQARYYESELRDGLVRQGEKPFTKLKVRVGHSPS